MNKYELNRHIHEKIMERCWHDLVVDRNAGTRVCYCVGECKADFEYIPFPNPDYCSDETPREVLREVVETLVTKHYSIFASEIVKVVNGDLIQMLNPTAEQIARACVNTHQKAKI